MLKFYVWNCNSEFSSTPFLQACKISMTSYYIRHWPFDIFITSMTLQLRSPSFYLHIYIFPIHQSERYVDGWNYNISGCYKCQVAILDRQGKKFWEVKVCDMPVAYMRNSVLHHAGLMLKGMEVFDVLTFWKKKSVLINYEVTHNLKAGLHQTRS